MQDPKMTKKRWFDSRQGQHVCVIQSVQTDSQAYPRSFLIRPVVKRLFSRGVGGDKGGCCVELFHVPVIRKFWELQYPGATGAYLGLYRDSFTFIESLVAQG